MIYSSLEIQARSSTAVHEKICQKFLAPSFLDKTASMHVQVSHFVHICHYARDQFYPRICFMLKKKM